MALRLLAIAVIPVLSLLSLSWLWCCHCTGMDGGSSRWWAVVVVVASLIVLVGHSKRKKRKERKHTLRHDQAVQAVDVRP